MRLEIELYVILHNMMFDDREGLNGRRGDHVAPSTEGAGLKDFFVIPDV